MKKTILTLALISSALAFNSAYAQLAKKKGITLDEISKEINTLAQKSDDASKTQLLIEAKALAESKNENFVNFGSRIYEFLKKEDEVEKINKTLLKKFPKGLKARSEAYESVFSDANTSAASAEKSYNAFLKKFPASNFEDKDKGLYTSSEAKLAGMYFKEKNTTKANEYVEKLKNGSSFIQGAYGLTSELSKNKDYANALPILKEAIEKSKGEKSINPNMVFAMSNLYSEALYETGNYTDAIKTIEDQFKTNKNASSSLASNITLAKSYAKVGKDLDAFLLLEKFAIKNGLSKEIEDVIQPLYAKLNNSKGDFSNFVSKLKVDIKEANEAKYKSQMIKEKAPEFSLINMEGKTVSLADMKGKVVVLDFWATWCGPCVGSFPGMQAGVDKYKDDKEVEFLFINCWQSEKNYKEVVEKFLADKNYRFHVLFDEMQDRSKSITTAYGVKGIPTKVFIDKEGFIRFNSSGGQYDVQKLVDELETKIELARKG